MKAQAFCTLGLLLLIHPPAPQRSVTGEWVAERVDARDVGEDVRMDMRMALIDRRGRVRERTLHLLRKGQNGLDRLLVRFTYPHDIRGTGFLVWEHREGADERFLYLPALGRVRRIAAQEREDSFVGTDFTYEDIGGRKLEDYTYRLLEEETLLDGKGCYLLESTPRDESSKFGRIVSWVDRARYVVLQAEYYDRRGRRVKRFIGERLEVIDGIWTLRRLTMEDLKEEHRTVLEVTEVSYNQGIDDRYFTRRELERGAGR